MSNDIRRIPQAIKLARRAQRKVVENVFLSIILKAGILALAFAGHPLIWAAVLVDVGTCILVILNSMLLLREKKKTGIKKCYRAFTSVLNGRKVEGDDDDVLDLEAGMLTKSGSGQCNSGCCGDKKNQETVMMRPSSKTRSDHSHPGCCGDKKQGNVKLVRDGCCGESTKKPEGDMASLSSCKKSTHVKNDLKMKGGSGCCANKNEKVKEVVAKSCCEKPKQQMESFGKCRSGHFEEKKHTEEILLMQTSLEIELQTKNGETCKSSCCDNKEKVRETVLLLSNEGTSYPDKGVLIEEEGSCKSSCCDGEIQTSEVTVTDGNSGCCGNKGIVKQSCHEKTCLEMEAIVCCDPKLVCCGNTEGQVGEKSDLEIMNEEHCKSGCCSDERQTGEITLASEEESDSSDCPTGCCVDEEEVTQVCNEQHVSLVVSGLETEAGDGKLLCCGSFLKQEGSSHLVNVESGHFGSSCCTSHTNLMLSDFQVKDEHCETSERAIKIETCSKVKKEHCETSEKDVKVETCCKVKKDEHCETSEGSDKVETCCTVKKDEHCETSEGAVKVETCCKVKTPEACGSKRQSGKSCCRSYAKEYCRHRHHHHHHHHVRA